MNKEYGSDFHLINKNEFLLENSDNSILNSENFSFFLSGRAALLNLIQHGIENHQWKTIFFPSYYCQEVINYLKNVPIEIKIYPYNPFQENINQNIQIEDYNHVAIVEVLFFGIKKRTFKKFKNAWIIEDITHGILNYKNSSAHYCFGSFRKELPVPAGGFIYSKQALFFKPEIISTKSDQFFNEKFTAMKLKKDYLSGKIKNKEEFRNKFIQSETLLESESIGTSLPSLGKEILQQLDIQKIIEKKYKNIKIAHKILKNNPYFKVISNSPSNKSFGLMLFFKNKNSRDFFKNYLINHSIYPAILWPNQSLEIDKDAENRNLFIHLDFRYDEEDIKFIIEKLNQNKLHE